MFSEIKSSTILDKNDNSGASATCSTMKQQVFLLSDQSNVSSIVIADSNKRHRRLPASDNHRSCSPCTSKNYYSTFTYPLLSSLFPMITYPVGTDASRKMGRGCSRMFYKAVGLAAVLHFFYLNKQVYFFQYGFSNVLDKGNCEDASW
ncbi:hypothetical protein CDAR_54131 [Caerostris darwini]|uniref:Succinate dehydrogenase subunit 4 n=1 Tax=Caerostris darwini TaxID=1538125 RepID=A0AAV4N128_9ARAC|nr:hypothetical protein CDAR_54131 [Caerostris darwini]